MGTESSQAFVDTDDVMEDSSDDIYEGISNLLSLSRALAALPWYPENFRFSDLPKDIRFCIYPYMCQVFHESYCLRFRGCSCLNRSIPLNKQLYFEMLSFLNTSFNISFKDSTSFYNYFQGIGGERIEYIKRVKTSYLGARSSTHLHFRKSFEALRVANQLEEFELTVEGLMFPPLLKDLEKFSSLRRIFVRGNGGLKSDLVAMEDVLSRRALDEGKHLELSVREWLRNEYEWQWELR